MEKIEKDGKVAVLYSPGFGAGWSTWDEPSNAETLCMDARIVGPFLQGNKEAAIAAAVGIIPDLYLGGAKSLRVEWVPKGKAFRITEYDGDERIDYLEDFVLIA